MKLTLNSIDAYADILRKNGITDMDLRRSYSDLYVGCTHEQAKAISKEINSPSICSRFRAQKGSDMDHYQICLELAFACVSLDFLAEKNFTTKYYYLNKSDEKVYLTNRKIKECLFSEFGALRAMGNEDGGCYTTPVFLDNVPVIKQEYAWKYVDETDWIYDYEQQEVS